MGQAKKKQQLREMGLDAQLQHDANKLVADADWLVQKQFAGWQKIELSDGTKFVVLAFPEAFWELVNSALTLKRKKNE